MAKFESTEFYCIKTLKETFGTFYKGKKYDVFKLMSHDIIYVNYHEEDMVDYKSRRSKKLKEVVPGLKFSLIKKNKYLPHLEYFYNYFSELKEIRKLKLKKLNERTI